MTAVLDASAILAFLFRETGWEDVKTYIRSGSVSAVNYSEVIARMFEANVPEQLITSTIDELGLELMPFDEALALEAARLRPLTRGYGLSLGDRACLATARISGMPALTADRAWANLDLGIEIRLIR